MNKQRSVPDTRIVIDNGRIVTPTAVIEGGVRVEGTRIAAIGDVDQEGNRVIDADGQFVMPGLIDLHGDDIESHLHPRSGAKMETHMALAAADRANIGAGITTKFHAISFELDPDEDRSPELSAEITDSIERADDLMAEHHIHARCEVTQPQCVEAVEDVIESGDAQLVSVMSHIPGKGQFRDREAFLEYYRNSEKHAIEEAYDLIDERGDLELETIRQRVDRVVRLANERDIPIASHDDEDPAEIERLHAIDIDISEYPITLATAQRAHELGLTVTMGAPNLVRGESQWGNLRTEDGIEADVVDALVADYYPPSLLAAVFVDTGEPLPKRVARVTANPADAVGFGDRGRIEPGKRADLIVVDPEPTPTVARALVGGQPVYRADPVRPGGSR